MQSIPLPLPLPLSLPLPLPLPLPLLKAIVQLQLLCAGLATVYNSALTSRGHNPPTVQATSKKKMDSESAPKNGPIYPLFTVFFYYLPHLSFPFPYTGHSMYCYKVAHCCSLLLTVAHNCSQLLTVAHISSQLFTVAHSSSQ